LPFACKESQWQVESFRWQWYERQQSVKYDDKTFARLNTIPAITNWIKPYPKQTDRRLIGKFDLNYEHFHNHGHVTVPIERTVWADKSKKKWDVKSFERFEAPLAFFLEWTKRRLAEPETFCPNESLYIAQCPIDWLPKALQDDLPAPIYCVQKNDEITAKVGKHEVMTGLGSSLTHTEDSSIWMGIPPTETPLHKDPNSNFLVQIAGRKTVRLMKPGNGEVLLGYAKRTIAMREHAQGFGGRLDVSMRGEEMMVGPERRLMSDLVWDTGCSGLDHKVDDLDDIGESVEGHNGHENDAANPRPTAHVEDNATKPDLRAEICSADETTHSSTRDQETSDDLLIWEVDLAPGDALFIPRGWYHSVRSTGDDRGGINVSANWWFRYKLKSVFSAKSQRKVEQRMKDG
jgi:hypothetical protein